MSEKLVSIIVPTYNRGRLLPRALKSIMEQSYKNWEVIVVDDRSTDNTKVVLEPWLKDKRFRVVTNKNSKGASGARNHGMEIAQGDYISFLDSDDTWESFHLKKSIEAIELFAADVCYGQWKIRDKDEVFEGTTGEFQVVLDRCIEELKAPVIGSAIRFGPDFLSHFLRGGLFCYHVDSLVMTRQAFEGVGYFNESMITHEDVDYHFRLTYKFGFVFLREYHFTYTIGESDSLYGFVNRAKITLDDLRKNKDLTSRLLEVCCDRVKQFTIIVKQFEFREYPLETHYAILYRLAVNYLTGCVLSTFTENRQFWKLLHHYYKCSKKLKNVLKLVSLRLSKGKNFEKLFDFKDLVLI